MAGTWTGLTTQPGFNTSTMFLLTDGRVMVQEAGSAHWHALTPDSSGSYVNGTWSSLADMSTYRLYYASGILKDGRVFICGGEYSGAQGAKNFTNTGEIYDPAKDQWTTIALPPISQVGDSPCCILPDGRVLIGDLNSTACYIYNPSTDKWSTAGSKSAIADEETWILLPDNTILTIQTNSPFGTEKYVIGTNTWQNEGTLPVTIVDTVMNEIGPGMLLYNGKTIFFGAANSSGNGKTVVYTRPATPTAKGTWTAGPNIPKINNQTMVSNDCPGALLPNGKVLVTVAQFKNNAWGQPVYFCEYDPSTNTMTQVPTPSNNNQQLYFSRMMLLPSGQVLFSPSSNNIQCYTPDGTTQEAWRPTVSSVTPHNTLWFTDYVQVQGTQLNGLSQANVYGDDVAAATNYPLVQLTNQLTGDVHYVRTYNFSTLGVATGSALQSLRFGVGGLPTGKYDLRVIANGIASHAVAFSYQRPHKSQIFDVGVKEELEHLGKEIYEVDIFKQFEEVINPEVHELRTQVKQLENSVRRLTSLIPTTQLPRVGKEIKERAGHNGQGADGLAGNGTEDTDAQAAETLVEIIIEEG